MIRSKSKIYAEANPENEVTSDNNLAIGKFIVASGNNTRKVESFNPGPKRLLITNTSSVVSSFFYGEPHKIIGVDNGALTLLNDPTVGAPPDRELIQEWIGSYLNNYEKTITLPPGWYEVEVTGGGGGGGGAARALVYYAVKPSSGSDGGDGGRYTQVFLLQNTTVAKIVTGSGGGGGMGRRYYNTNGSLATIDYYQGGAGGVYTGPFLFSSIGNNGLNPLQEAMSGIRLGGLGKDGGARGGNITLGDDYVRSGGTGGGATGPYGGNGGDIYVPGGFTYGNHAGVGGAGGAGGSLGKAGKGGGSDSPLGAAEASSGASGGNADATVIGLALGRPGGGGGGGAASRFICGSIDIVAGGGGGGAGGSFGITDNNNTQHAKDGAPGGNNINSTSGGGDANGGKGGVGAQGYVVVDGPTGQIMIPNGSNIWLRGEAGYPGTVRLWKRIFAPTPPPSGGGGGNGGDGGSKPPFQVVDH